MSGDFSTPPQGSGLESALALLERLCAESSPSGDGAGLERMARTLAAELGARGFGVEIQPRKAVDGESRPVLVARSASGGRKPLLLIGHFDTVLAAAPPRRDGERLVATGSIDMKGGIATFLAALDRLAAAGTPTPRDLLVVLVPDEEVAGAISKRATAEHGAAARACCVLDPGELRAGGAETVVAGRRGMTNLRLELHGRSAHSGLAFHEGRSAVAAAGAWIAAAAALSRTGRGPTVNLSRVIGGERALVESPASEGSLFGTERMLNVVPDRAVVEGEFRYLDPADGAEVRTRLEGLAGEVASATGVRCELSFGAGVAPVAPTPARAEAARRAVELAALRGWRLEIEIDRGGISFPNFLPLELDLPVLDGLGPAGGGMHTRDEFVDVRSFGRRIALLADLLKTEVES